MQEFAGRPKLRPFLERSGDGRLRGIIMGSGPVQTQLRRFAFRNLRDFGFGRASMESMIMDEAHELMNALSSYEGSPFQTKYVFNMAAVNSLWWIINGERFTYEDEQLKLIVKQLTDGMMDSPSGAFLFFPWLSRLAPNLTGYNSFMEFQYSTQKLIRQKYHEQREAFVSGRHRHFMDVFIQEVMDTKDSSSPFYGAEGETNLVSSICDLFDAGIETTSTTMSWVVLLLALHPNVQDKMWAEITALTCSGSQSRAVTLDDQPHLPYVEAVITEVLRYSSIFPLSVFHSTLEDVHFHGYDIPKDTMIMPNLYGLHHDPAIWGDPAIFRPERFVTPEGRVSKPVDAFMAFSLGKRGCIGEKLARNTIFLFVTTIFHKYRIIPNPERPKPCIDYTPTFTLQPKPYEYVLELRATT